MDRVRMRTATLAVLVGLSLLAVTAGCSTTPPTSITLDTSVTTSTVTPEVTLTGRVTPAGTPVTVQVGHTGWRKATVKGGLFLFTATLQPGKNDLQFRATAKADGKTALAALSIVYLPPVPMSWTSPKNNQQSQAVRISIDGTCQPDAALTLSVAGPAAPGSYTPQASVTTVSVDSAGRFHALLPVSLGVTRITLDATAEGCSPVQIVRTVTRIEPPATYKASCKTVAAQTFLNQASSYQGKRISIVAQIGDSSMANGDPSVLVNVLRSTGTWSGLVQVFYPNDSPYPVGTIVRIWGEGAGVSSVNDANTPAINAKYIEKSR